MDTMIAFARGQAARASGANLMVFDWNKAHRLLTESGVDQADAYLRGDRGFTGGCIWLNGEPSNEDYVYLSSLWAVPVLEINGEEVECWQFEEAAPDDWDDAWPTIVAATAEDD